MAASAFPQQLLLQRLRHVDATKPEMVQAESLPRYNKQGSALRTAARRLLVSARDQKLPQEHLCRSRAAWKAKTPREEARGGRVPYLLRLSRFGQDQSEEAQADLLVLGGAFANLREKKQVLPVRGSGDGRGKGQGDTKCTRSPQHR